MEIEGKLFVIWFWFCICWDVRVFWLRMRWVSWGFYGLYYGVVGLSKLLRIFFRWDWLGYYGGIDVWCLFVS